MPGISTSAAPGTSLAVSRPCSGGSRASSRPWIASQGTETVLSMSTREPPARTAAYCRFTPSGVQQRS